MANFSYKKTTTKNLKVKGVYDAKKSIVTVIVDKEGNEVEYYLPDLLDDFDGLEINMSVSDKEESDLLEDK